MIGQFLSRDGAMRQTAITYRRLSLITKAQFDSITQYVDCCKALTSDRNQTNTIFVLKTGSSENVFCLPFSPFIGGDNFCFCQPR